MTSTIKRTVTSAAVALCALFFSVSAFADEPKGEIVAQRMLGPRVRGQDPAER